MCFSKEVSLSTFLIGTGLSLYIFFGLGSPTDKIVSGFFGYVSLMQGIEYLLWDHQICDQYHKSVSYAGMWLNHLQPIVLGVLILIYGSPTVRSRVLTVMGLYIAAIIPFSLQYDNIGDMRCTTPKKENPHLVWNWNTMPHQFNVYLLFVGAIMTLFIFGMAKNGAVMAALTASSLIVSLLFYPRGTIGAVWCIYAAFAPLMYMFAKGHGIF